MNRKFWTLPSDQRKALLEEKMTKKEYLSGFSCLGHLDKNQSLIISANSDWVCTFSHETHPEEAILHEAFPYEHSRPIQNEDVANRLLTKYCYEKGVNPKSISFVLGNHDIISVAKGRKFGFLQKKQKFIMRHVYVYIMP